MNTNHKRGLLQLNAQRQLSSTLLLAILCQATPLAVRVQAASPAGEEPNATSETLAAHDARMAWWRDARFGTFIHFGIYAIPGRGEWARWLF